MADNPDNLEIKDNDSGGSGKKKEYYITISNDGEYIARLDCSKDESLRLKITRHENFELLNNVSDSDIGHDKVKICDIVKKLTFLDELDPYVKPSDVKGPQKEDNKKQKEKTKRGYRKLEDQTKEGNGEQEEKIEKDNKKQKEKSKLSYRKREEQTKEDNSKQEEQIKEDNRKLLIWSFSISNRISFNKKPTILVAISRVVPNDMIDHDRPNKHLLDKLEEYKKLKLKYQNMKELYPLHTQPYKDGKVLNVLEHIEFFEFKVFENDDDNDGIKEKSFTIFKEFNANSNYSNHWYRCADNDADKHKIFDPFKKHDDVSNSKISLLIDNKEKLVDIDQIIPIVNNKEQWVDRKNYEKTSAFIDENQSLQLIIGLTTVQIWLGCRKFELEVTWGDDEISKKIQWPYPDQYVTPIKHACKALEYLNFKEDLLVSYKKQHRFEEMYEYIVKIILKFIRDKPEIWRLMDTRYEIMSNLINGGVNSLIKYILFGKDQIGDNILAINYSKKKDKLIVGYLLEYYSNNAIEHIGWMITVSTTLPLLFQSHLEDYVYDLFYKECFAGNNIGINFKLSLDKELASNSIGINSKLKEDTESNLLQSSVEKIPCFKKNAFGNQNRASPNLCVVPLPNFTVNKIEKKNVQKNVVITCLRRLILPHRYIDDEEKLSSFIQMIGLDRKGLIFDNPAIEALINFRWKPAKIYLLLHSLTFIQYAACYVILIWAYTTYQNSSNNLRNFLILVMGYFYFTGYHLLSIEFAQLKYYKFRKYFSNKYNILDIIAIIVPLIVETTIIVKSFEIEDAFGSAKPDQGTIAAISISMLILWIEFLSYLRLFEGVGIYIIITEKLLGTVWPFLLFMLIVILAFAHTMYILLQNPNDIGLVPNVNTYSIINTNDQTLYNDITIKADFDSTSSIDNPFSTFFSSIPAAYFWINGNWINRDTYGSYFMVQILSLIASLLIVSIIQNMFIAFMSNVYEKTSQESKLELLKLQAAFISDYEALEDGFLNPPKPDPKYICYNNNNFDSWKERTKSRRGCLYTKYENENSYIQYILEKKDFDHQADSLWQFHKELDDFNDDGVNEKISNLEKKMNANNNDVNKKISNLEKKMDKIISLLTKP
ncbi:6069_t:CDS:2 [Entrophospora sp. SA101]|nr:6069_t:CDS:2 [Entrophospora sp. SA101]